MSRDWATAAGAFALVAALGFDDGGYPASAWGWSSVVLLATLAVLLARGVYRPRTAAVVAVAALAGLAAWQALSLLWSSHVSASVLEVERTLTYVAAAAVFVLVGSAPALPAGVLAASTVVCAYGLTQFDSGERLFEPLGYANGVGMLAVIGLLVSLGLASRSARASLACAAAAAAPLLAASLYLTFSRGSWLALGVGLAAAVAIGPERLRLAATGVALAVPGALAMLAAEQLLLVLALCALAAVIPLGLRAAPVPPPAARTAFAVALAAAPVVVVALLLVKVGGPREAWDSFKAAPTPTHGQPSRRVLDLSGRNRADYWTVAWRSYEDDPLLGAGAGTYARTWLRERPVPQPVTDAHNLYLETLAELGPIGLVLLLTALAAPFAGVRDPWAAVALAPYAAFLAHAAQDWDWELPALTVAGLACGIAAIAGPAGPRLSRVAAVAPVGLAVLAALAFAGNQALERSIDAMDGLRWDEAARDARRARTLQPWSPEPWRVLGEVELAEGSLAASRRYFRSGIREDPDEFELWIGLGLASEGRARRAAFVRAYRLNPLSPDLEELGFKTGSAG